MLPLAGCLVADPPLYHQPDATPPILDLSAATPFLNSVIVIDLGGSAPMRTLTINVPFRSDDKGEWVHASLHVDYTFESEQFTGAYNRFPPSTLEDEDRNIRLVWPLKETTLPAPGCHTLTLLASHESTWNAEAFRPDVILAQGDTAMATWWMNIDPGDGDPYTLENCPSRREVQSQ